jgi:hypothetical protein
MKVITATGPLQVLGILGTGQALTVRVPRVQ